MTSHIVEIISALCHFGACNFFVVLLRGGETIG